VVDTLEVPGVGKLEATLINAGLPTIFVDAAALGLKGIELQDDVNGNPELLARCEAIRAHGAVRMGLAKSAQEATESRPHSPKIAFVAPPATYTASSGKMVAAGDIDLLARILSMGKLHHAMTGTGAVAIAVACAVPGTRLRRILGDAPRERVRFGHTSGTLAVGAEAVLKDGEWAVTKALMSRSARRLMDGTVFVPASVLAG
jgi:2-methylaconitate cis-trans-isomerase PrpF